MAEEGKVMKTVFTERMARAMFMKGIRQSEIVYKTGIDKGSISSYINGRYKPSADNIAKIADALGVTSDWLLGREEIPISELMMPKTREVKILGSVAAGVPITAQEDVIGVVYSDIQKPGLFALKIKGDSISPRIMDGDTVLVQAQETANDGDLVIAMIDGEATCKVFKKSHSGITLIPFNMAYPPFFYTGEGNDFRILGKVVESHHRWE